MESILFLPGKVSFYQKRSYSNIFFLNRGLIPWNTINYFLGLIKCYGPIHQKDPLPLFFFYRNIVIFLLLSEIR